MFLINTVAIKVVTVFLWLKIQLFYDIIQLKCGKGAK
jgi:hypothetical protein